MSNKLLPYAGALLIIQALSGCSPENGGNSENATLITSNISADGEQKSVETQGDQRLILAFGDSLYAGYGVLPQESFPAQLQAALTTSGMSVKVQNAGVSGDTTAAGLRRLAFTLDGLERKPDLVMVNLGGNDMLRGIDPKETRANLTAICDELKRRGIPIMLTGMVAAPNLGPDYAASFNPIYADLAKSYNAVLYPFFLDGIVTDPKLMLSDRVHPTAQGLSKIVERVTPLVQKAVEENTPPTPKG